MAIDVTEIVDVADKALDDDEVYILHSMPPAPGTNKSNPIPVDNYRRAKRPPVIIDLSEKTPFVVVGDVKNPRKFHKGESSNSKSSESPKQRPVIIDLSEKSPFVIDDVKVLKTPRRFYKGECSNSKSSESPKRRPVVIDLSEESNVPRNFYKGECCNSTSSESPNQPLPLIFTCEICVDEKPRSDAFCVQGCSHSYCTECIVKYVASKLQDNITTITCPVPNCKGYFEPYHCRFILPKAVFDRWGDALCEALILGSEKFYCPYKDCSALLLHDSKEAIAQSECPSCYRLFCASCKSPWHTGISCADFQKLHKDERSKEDILLMNLANTEKWKRCPKCKFYVSRISGCLFMKCRCGHSFCYNCGSAMKGTSHYCKICKH